MSNVNPFPLANEFRPVLTQGRVSLKVPLARARALVLALASGDHLWETKGPLTLPEDPGSFEKAVALVDEDERKGRYEDSDGVTNYWRPDTKLEENGSFLWRPWAGNGGRYVRVHRDGRVEVYAGTNKSPWRRGGSVFLGGLLVAAAGGLDHCRGLVEPRQAK